LGDLRLADDSVNIDEGDTIILIQIENGLVAVIGDITYEDEPILKRLLEAL